MMMQKNRRMKKKVVVVVVVVGECTNSYYSSQWACHDINITKIEQKHKQKRKSIH